MGLILFGANNPEIVRQAQALAASGAVRVIGLLDNDPDKQGRDFHGFPVLGGIERVAELAAQGHEFVNVITRDGPTRHRVTRAILQAGGRLGQFIHPQVDCGHVRMGEGSYIQQYAMLQAEVVLGRNCSISAGALVNHECVLGDSVFLAPGVNLCGKVTVGDGVFIGASAVILPRLCIGAWAIIGAGAVVTRDVPPGAVVAGNPARVLRVQSITEEALDG